MEQRKRPGGKGGLGYYTAWDKSATNGCIYCGKAATTREHIPSKVFLLEPYPENLATLPACFECNNGFSEDEKYIACFLDVLKEAVYEGYKRQASTVHRLENDDALRSLIESEIQTVDGKVLYRIDENRLCRILIKLAKGHAAFEWDGLHLDGQDIHVSYEFAFNMSKEALDQFEKIPEIHKISEVGSRSTTVPFLIFQSCESGAISVFALWNDVQEGRYRYQMSYNENGGVRIKIVIYEMLYCQIDFC